MWRLRRNYSFIVTHCSQIETISTFFGCEKSINLIMPFRFPLHRFIEEEPIHEPKLLLIVGCLGLLVNLIGLLLLYGKNFRESDWWWKLKLGTEYSKKFKNRKISMQNMVDTVTHMAASLDQIINWLNWRIPTIMKTIHLCLRLR